MPAQSRHWCLTINNYTEIPHFESMRLTYFVCGKEVGASGTPHLQVYVVYPKKKRLGAVVKDFQGCHAEIMRGTAQQAAEYCKKDGDFIEGGILPLTHEEGSQEMWRQIVKMSRENRLEELADSYPGMYVRYYTTLKTISFDHMPCPARIDNLEHEWIWGASRVGKSYYARNKYPDAYIKNLNKWWDNYKGEDVVIIEEWSPNMPDLLIQHLKRWADHYPFSAEVKGGTVKIRPRKIVITSNYSMSECFPVARDLDALENRFTECLMTRADALLNPAKHKKMLLGKPK